MLARRKKLELAGTKRAELFHQVKAANRRNQGTMVTPLKQKIVTKLLGQLGKITNNPFSKKFSVLDHLLFAVIQEDTSLADAMQAFNRLLGGFYDLNELRVSHRLELEDFLAGIPQREEKARRLIQILQFVYETTYSFDLESMKKKPLRQAQRQLSKITGVTPYAVAATVQRSLGGHSVPLDEATVQVLVRLTLAEKEENREQIRTAIEHIVPKAKGLGFSLLLNELAFDEKRMREITSQALPKPRGRSAKAGGSDDESEPVEAKPSRTKTATSKRPTKEKKSI